jgi:hypothetical protein
VSDEFLTRLQEKPRAEFEEALGARLREIDVARGQQARRPTPGLRPLVAGLGLAAIAVALSLPPVRATAREFLDLFRVQRVAAVPVDSERLSRLEQGGVDIKAFVESQVEVLDPAVAPETVESAELAGSLAGLVVREPRSLPEGASLAGVAVGHPGAYRVRFDVAKIRSLAELMGVEDVTVPDSWQGAEVEVHAPPVVALTYRRGGSEFRLLQSRGPEVALPEGIDLAELGAVGLQLSGMSAAEARIFARRIDWRSTLLVPIPLQGGSFREVELGGRKGVLVTTREPRHEADGTVRPGAWHSVLLWADEDHVYALGGPGHGVEIVEMAESLG